MDGQLLAVPNVSTGDPEIVRRLIEDLDPIDVHTDPDHNRAVLTFAEAPDRLVRTCVELVRRAVELLDIREHRGVHPRHGVVDVLPIVPYTSTEAETVADAVAGAISVPVLRYGPHSLPNVRRQLRERPPVDADPTAGVLCLGVRGPLVAFNVNLRGPLDEARRVAQAVRDAGRIRALAFPLPSRGLVQVSMNLVDPLAVGPREAFDRVVAHVEAPTVEDAEVVGLLPDQLAGDTSALPLSKPARTIAEALRDRGA